MFALDEVWRHIEKPSQNWLINQQETAIMLYFCHSHLPRFGAVSSKISFSTRRNWPLHRSSEKEGSTCHHASQEENVIKNIINI